MKLSKAAAAVILAAGTLAQHLPKCSDRSPTPCACPNGTSYAQSVTFAVIGAAAADVAAVTSSFFNPGWLGVTPYARTGTDNVPGATRSSRVPTAYGTYNLTEKLVQFKSARDGSFVQIFELLPSTIPVEYQAKNGTFSGYWITLQSKYIFQNETDVAWSVYACSTGNPQNYARFHESALANATNTLEKAGKITGQNVKAFSVQNF